MRAIRNRAHRVWSGALGHGAGLDSWGAHNDRKRGGCDLHRDEQPPQGRRAYEAAEDRAAANRLGL